MTKSHHLLSAGIDVGTTSTHLAISRLTLSNCSVVNQTARLAVSARELVFQSPVHFTPLTAEGLIDGNGVARIVMDAYGDAGIQPHEIQSGAAIITGESARVRNAAEVIEALAELAGEFVIASAGPRLEAVLAARGSGAVDASLAGQCTICNIDIGGGTSNLAVYSGGQLVDAACLGIGGRFLRLSGEGEVLSLTDSGEVFLDAVAKSVRLNEKVSEERLETFADLLAETILHAVLRKRPPQITQRLMLTDGLRHDYKIDQLWFSGGVAELMRESPQSMLAYGDMGAYLGKSLVAALGERGTSYNIPPSPIRATVIGAGMHTLQLSGSTVAVEPDNLPMRNVPLIRPFAHGETSPDKIKDLIRAQLDNHDLEWRSHQLALCLNPMSSLDFETISKWADGLTQAFLDLEGKDPLIVIVQQDVALALGQLMRRSLPRQKILVVDGINPNDGDYIDIGRPVAGGQAIPVVVKTLVFAQDL